MTFELRRGGANFPWHVIDAQGSPHLTLTLYACKAFDRHSSKTASTYIRHVIAFATWAASDAAALRQGWSLHGAPDAVRALVSRFLSTEVQSIVSLATNKLGLEVQRVVCKWQGGKGHISHVLAALRSYYSVLISEGRYQFQNPMIGSNASEIIARDRLRSLEAFKAKHGRSPMPSDSGVDAYVRSRPSDSYFRLADSTWIPTVLDDPELISAVLSAGERYGWSLRDTCVARILFDTGCRIHEACSLNVADWARYDFGQKILSVNKGSRGAPSKALYLSDTTVKMLRSYLLQEHPQRTVSEVPITLRPRKDLDFALFVTRVGTQLSPDLYRRNSWNPALAMAGLRVRPHQIRHWYVTGALRLIDQTATTEDQRANERAKLRLLMGWKSDMLPVYDQAVNHNSLPELAAKIHQNIDARHSEATQARRISQATASVAPSNVDRMLDDLLGSQ